MYVIPNRLTGEDIGYGASWLDSSSSIRIETHVGVRISYTETASICVDNFHADCVARVQASVISYIIELWERCIQTCTQN